MKSFENMPDKDRRFALRVELSGNDVSTLLQTLGTAEEFDLQDLVRGGLTEVTGEKMTSKSFNHLDGRSSKAS
jgi:hypothetical protein